MKVLLKNSKTVYKPLGEFKPCISRLSKIKGLMFTFSQKNLLFDFGKEVSGKNICFHMWFVFYPIDIILLNSKKEVVELKTNFLPFTFYKPKAKFRYALECSNGFVKENKIKLTQKLVFSSAE